jgi:hypothetical protein
MSAKLSSLIKEERIMPKEKVRQQMERLQALPQRRFIRHQTDGDAYYLYANKKSA